MYFSFWFKEVGLFRTQVVEGENEYQNIAASSNEGAQVVKEP